MSEWVGVYRPSIGATEPWWMDDAERFIDLRHAVKVFAARNMKQRPKSPPLRVGWDEWGKPTVLPATLPWLIPAADPTAVLRLVPLTSDTTLGVVTTMVSQHAYVVIRLNREGRVIVTKPKGIS